MNRKCKHIPRHTLKLRGAIRWCADCGAIRIGMTRLVAPGHRAALKQASDAAIAALESELSLFHAPPAGAGEAGGKP